MMNSQKWTTLQMEHLEHREWNMETNLNSLPGTTDLEIQEKVKLTSHPAAASAVTKCGGRTSCVMANELQ